MPFSFNGASISDAYVNGTRVRSIYANAVLVWNEAGDVSTLTFSTSFSTATQTTSPYSIWFKSDGLMMYVLGGFTQRKIHGYSLSVAWDISTASFVSSTPTFTEESTGAFFDLYFNSTGTKVYVVGDADNIYEHTLSTAWNVSTASATASATFSFGLQDTDGRGLGFSSDGTKMYIGGNSTDTVYQYTLSTPWSISTASYSSKSHNVFTDGGVATPYSIRFNTNGTKMYTYYFNKIHQYDLSVAWDISTASYFTFGSVFDLTSYGMFISSDGLRVYHCSDSYDSIRAYNVGV